MDTVDREVFQPPAVDLDSPLDNRAEGAKILLASTTYWPSAARMAIALKEADCRVAAIYPKGNPLSKTFILTRSYPYRSGYPLWSLKSAIRQFRPALIVPCDDRVVRHLHSLYSEARRQRDPFITAVIERSLGHPDSYRVADGRMDLMRLAADEEVRVPASRHISNTADLEEWARTHQFPWVLKCDGSTAGEGVAVVLRREEAFEKFRKLSRPMSARSMARMILRSAEWFWLRHYASRRRPAVTVQEFIAGQPANIAVACWEGKVLAATSAVALSVASSYGATTVARIVENPQMLAAARQVVSRLQLSGFVGFDFIVEDETGNAYLIEMNPRFTQLSTLQLGGAGDLIAALRGALSCAPVAAARAVAARPVTTPAGTTKDTVAFFPQAWLSDPNNPLIEASHHDVPWRYPELVRELTRIPRPQRGLAARVARRLAKL